MALNGPNCADIAATAPTSTEWPEVHFRVCRETKRDMGTGSNGVPHPKKLHGVCNSFTLQQ
jgi:hypothetical protein